jgi:hypothetical protein
LSLARSLIEFEGDKAPRVSNNQSIRSPSFQKCDKEQRVNQKTTSINHSEKPVVFSFGWRRYPGTFFGRLLVFGHFSLA